MRELPCAQKCHLYIPLSCTKILKVYEIRMNLKKSRNVKNLIICNFLHLDLENNASN